MEFNEAATRGQSGDACNVHVVDIGWAPLEVFHQLGDKQTKSFDEKKHLCSLSCAFVVAIIKVAFFG